MIFAMATLAALAFVLVALKLERMEKKMATGAQALTDLSNAVNGLTTAVVSAIADITDLQKQIADLHAAGQGADPAQVEALATQITQITSNLTAAVAPPPTPAP